MSNPHSNGDELQYNRRAEDKRQDGAPHADSGRDQSQRTTTRQEDGQRSLLDDEDDGDDVSTLGG